MRSRSKSNYGKVYGSILTPLEPKHTTLHIIIELTPNDAEAELSCSRNFSEWLDFGTIRISLCLKN